MKKRLDFRLEEYELEILEEYCKTVGRTKSDVLRELVRGLKRKIKTDRRRSVSGSAALKSASATSHA